MSSELTSRIRSDVFERKTSFEGISEVETHLGNQEVEVFTWFAGGFIVLSFSLPRSWS